MSRLSLHKLIKLFILTLSGIILIATIFYVTATVNSFNSEKLQVQNNVSSQVTSELQNNVLVTNNIADYLSESTSRINNIEQYLKNDPENYTNFIINQREYFNWPETSKDFFIKNTTLSQLQVRMNDNKNIFIANNIDTTGKIIDNSRLSGRYMLYSPIINPNLQEVVGVVETKFDESNLEKI